MGSTDVFSTFNLKHYVSQYSSESYSYEVIDHAFVNLSEIYIAIKSKATNEVICIIAHVHIRPHSYTIREFEESSGVYWCNCPERILKVLTPTTNQYALKWRESCWRNVRLRKAMKLKPGMVVVNPHRNDPQRQLTMLNRIHGQTWHCKDLNDDTFRTTRRSLYRLGFFPLEFMVEEKL